MGPGTRLLIDRVTHAFCDSHEEIEYEDHQNNFCDNFLLENWKRPVESCPDGQSDEEDKFGGIFDEFLSLSRVTSNKRCNFSLPL